MARNREEKEKPRWENFWTVDKFEVALRKLSKAKIFNARPTDKFFPLISIHHPQEKLLSPGPMESTDGEKDVSLIAQWIQLVCLFVCLFVCFSFFFFLPLQCECIHKTFHFSDMIRIVFLKQTSPSSSRSSLTTVYFSLMEQWEAWFKLTIWKRRTFAVCLKPTKK